MQLVRITSVTCDQLCPVFACNAGIPLVLHSTMHLTVCMRRALDCMLDMPSSIPYASLFPHKKTVAKALLVSL
jgi:hypothetical protein